MYPAQVNKLTKIEATLTEVIEWLQEKVDNADESDIAQDRAQAIEDCIATLESAQSDLTAGKEELEAVE